MIETQSAKFSQDPIVALLRAESPLESTAAVVRLGVSVSLAPASRPSATSNQSSLQCQFRTLLAPRPVSCRVRNLFYALTAYANPQLTTRGCKTTVHYLRPRLFWDCSLRLGLQVRVERGERHQDAVGPAEADLRRIFAASALVAARRSDVVFLDELRVTPV